MPVGRPDWYNAGQSQNVPSMFDMAELAVRLGSPIIYDRSGKMLFIEIFSRLDALWAKTDVGIGTTGALDTTTLETGLSSIKWITNVGAANYEQWSRYFRTIVTAKLGLEVGVMVNIGNAPIMIGMEVYDGVNYTDYQVYLDTPNLRLYYKNNAGALIQFTTFNFDIGLAPFFSPLKLHIDNSPGQYTRLSFNGDDFDMTGLEARQVASAYPPCVRCYFRGYGSGLGAATWHLDRLFLSEDI
jgi:hypothetical protein